MPKQEVGTGESTSSLAKKLGFFWRDIWEHGENAELKAKRKDPNVLFADDMIYIPEKEIKWVDKPTEQKHKFKRKGEPCKLRLQLMKSGKPRANEKYVLNLDGTIINGTTDGEGKLEHFIPGEAKTGILTILGSKEAPINLRISDLDPADLVSGIKQRLNNLGFPSGTEDDQLDERAVEAIKKFQEAHGLNVTGEVDDAVKSKLKELCK